LAEAEVEYQDKTSFAIDVRFVLIDEAALLERCPDAAGKGILSTVIWTTTPWTLPANQAVALNAELDYVIVQTPNERLLLAEALYLSVLERAEITDYQVLAQASGNTFEGLQLQHPFYQRHVPIILGEHVTTDAGTGAVHTAPGHGQEDFIVGQKYGLAIDNPVGANGVFLPNTEIFAGEYVHKANTHVLEVLEEKQALLCSDKLRHSYPHCWRHHTPLIFRATAQWFISMDQNGLRQASINAAKKTHWMPDWGEARIIGMLEGAPDWCVSRQRTWGVPITLFVHKETGE
jgi:isoleucyl-tRNA synthetase